MKQLKTQEYQNDDDVVSDGDDDDDNDEEGDAVETECEKKESLSASKDEESGEELLANNYTELAGNHRLNGKRKPKLIDDGPLTRPVTPRREPVKSNSAPSLSTPDSRFAIRNEERPHTASTRGAKKSPEEGMRKGQPKKTKVNNFKQAFASRPKIPRSPDVQSPSKSPNKSPDIPPLTRSLSPPRPPSGKR